MRGKIFMTRERATMTKAQNREDPHVLGHPPPMERLIIIIEVGVDGRED